MARASFPSLILLDVMLPYMDGYDVCLRLRQSSLTKYIPILFLTQRDERASKVRGLELGADDYITKPFDIDELRLRVQGSIARATRESLHEARTGLPTGLLIQDEIDRRRGQDIAYYEMAYAIDGFTSYQDRYGFVAANEVLAYAGSTIQKVLSEYGTPDDFVGIQNDEFIVLSHTEDPASLDEAIRERFAQEVRAFYNFDDIERGGLLIDLDGAGEQFIPLMSFGPARRQVSA
jgi:PleD family two-component response regulator